MATKAVPAEVLVLGGGPAACAAATLLGRWGHDVLLVARPPAAASPLGESIPPSTHKLFGMIGALDAMNAAGFVRSTGNTVWWGDEAPRVERFPGGQQGWQVTTDRLEAILRQGLAGARVRIEHARAEADLLGQRGARFVLDCTGRAGVLARARRLRVLEPAGRTIALVGIWNRGAAPWELPDATHTAIESYSDGWVWSVPASLDQRFVAVMVDPSASALTRNVSSRDVYLRELQRTHHMASLLRNATLASGPAGWDATMYHAERYVDGQVLLVGDAGSFIDPLSSAGVKKALASGWLAAVAVHTSLRRPDMQDIALHFFSDREAEVYASFRSMTHRFLSRAAAAHPHPFWDDRTETWDEQPEREAVQAAFERLRAEPELRVTRNPDARVAERPAVSGAEIVLEPRLISNERPDGVRYAFDIDLVALVELAPSCTSVPVLAERYNRQFAPVALPNLLGGLSTAIAQKWLLWV
jgi:2-polyprenyl-6-methoxyphenol hydroxylase-like FAD-dependent oxidoreductase